MRKKIELSTSQGSIHGYADSRFMEVVEAFAENFEKHGEVGANCALTIAGAMVVDLWGGRVSPDGQPWQEDTICMVFSSTKGAMSLCAHLLANRGKLDLDAKVEKYWPEFAVGGKESARVSMTLDHTVGVPHLRGPVAPGDFWDYHLMVDRVAAEPAFWEPGTQQGYHGITMAWTVGELIRRASGRRLGDFFREELALPLGADFFIGLPETDEARVAPMIMAEPDQAWLETRFIQAALTTKDTPTALFMRDFATFEPNSRACRAAEVGSANGMANGRALAKLYAPFANGGMLDGKQFVHSETITRMGRVASATEDDATLKIPARFALGFMKATDNRALPNVVNSSLLMTESAFGHVGAGGSVGLADPECKMSFGYAMNRMGTGVLLNARGQSLLDAVYRSLGYRTNSGGVWTA
jgi:CubicO group peptidase (beta-lactamase class C family)